MHHTADIQSIAATVGSLYAYGREEEYEPGQLIMWKVNNLPIRGSLEVILEVIGDIRDTNDEVVCVINGNNNQECG